jgi:hypothetical protein
MGVLSLSKGLGAHERQSGFAIAIPMPATGETDMQDFLYWTVMAFMQGAVLGAIGGGAFLLMKWAGKRGRPRS